MQVGKLFYFVKTFYKKNSTKIWKSDILDILPSRAKDIYAYGGKTL